MKARRFGITVVAVATVAAALGAGTAMTGGAPAWLEALNARSEGLNAKYGLGDQPTRRALGAPGPGWLAAIQARSEAMNRYYRLGEYASRQTARTSDVPDWLYALNARSEALNRHYGLGRVSAGRRKG